MCLCQFMILLDTTIVNVALPSMQRELGIRPENLEWVVNAYVVTLTALLLTGGVLGDRYGRRRLLLVGLAVFTLASAACALSTDDPELILFRAVQGVGAALMAPLTLSALTDAYSPEEAPRAIGIWAGVSGLGFAAGPVVGGILVERFDWSAIFWVNVPIGAAAAALIVHGVRESRSPVARRLDVVGTLLVTVGLALLVLGVTGTNTHSWLGARTLGVLAAAAVALAAFVAWEARAPEPMLPLSLFARPGFSPAIVTTTLAYVSLAGILFFITLYFQDVRGLSPIQAGLAWLPLNVFFLASAPRAGPLARRFGAERVVVTGMAIAAVATIGLALAGANGYGAYWPWYLPLGLGYGLATPSIVAAAMRAIEPARSGVAAGAVNVARQLGSCVGLAVLGSVAVGVAVNTWSETVADLPPVSRPAAAALGQAVAGGQTSVVERALGPAAAGAAGHAFVDGMRAALWVAAGALVLGALTGGIGAARGHRTHAVAPEHAQAMSR